MLDDKVYFPECIASIKELSGRSKIDAKITIGEMSGRSRKGRLIGLNS